MNIICKIFGHKLKAVKRFSDCSCKCYCSRCKKFFGVNMRVQAIVDWDCELEAFYKGD